MSNRFGRVKYGKAFNRTIVELKWVGDSRRNADTPSFNRTIVELK